MPPNVTKTPHIPQESTRLGLLDVVRIVGGLLLANAFFSWWFTSTPTWGYEGRLTDPRYLQFQIFGSYLNLTMDELSYFDGSDPTKPIYVGINGKLYDVTVSRSVYGPRGSYSAFAGKDAARAFSSGCFRKKDELTYDLRGLDLDEALEDIRGWQDFYANHRRYWFVGHVQHDPLVGDPPTLCETKVKYPFKKGG
ncbi:hypothetical protein BABINDRAFT_37264 [Babjeviella inositovora NRRL Y-12698]|uniref:Cytochrome b5 heme-binding domain-containing protein n=1 Tax=Babjeviella inositovora NRRL Y-12698 TaxID=984486 RepID=A0A1E3QPC1_9ASCO|nr:uncharacterized protein BABINDRAFT_37264 [Babjeviella inositovora NRRL Y-12698]ODQ79511.1 hypothetical protein BABINDRAFT_37264 [Babjeviella inositovora NRRL Y-12698]